MQAKAWYESNYPKTSHPVYTLNSSGSTAATTQTDLSQMIAPDWHHSASYNRLGKDVIEIPIDPSSKFSSAMRKGNTDVYKKEYSRSSFLLFKNGKSYQAYVMTIIADEAYVNNDLSKLSHNTYRKHDTDFSGVVLYFTPKGQFIRSWQYKDGKIVSPQTNTVNSTSNSRLKTENNETPISDVPCTYWYWAHYVDGELVDLSFAFSICDDGGGGATSPTPCPSTDPGGNSLHLPGQPSINAAHDPVGGDPGPGDGSGSGDPGDGGLPDPTNNTCTISNIQDVKDSLTNTCFENVKNLIATDTHASFGSIGQIINISFGFSHTWNLVFKNANIVLVNGQPAEASTGATYHSSDHTQIDVNITLSNSALQGSSQQYVAAAIIHEVMHAYFRLENVTGDHELMATNYITQMSQALQDTFHISADDATALAWGGLNENAQGVAITDAWTQFKTAHPDQATNIQFINTQYQTGQKGLRCN